MAPPLQAEQAYSHFLVNQVRASIEFLVQQHQISRPDATLILSKLPSTIISPASAAPPTAGLASLGLNETFEPATPSSQATQPFSSTTKPNGAGAGGRVVPPVPTPQAAPRPPPAAPQKLAKALWAYSGSAPDDLNFAKNDTILVLSEENADWWRGEVLSRPGITGLFPANHVERLPDEPAPPPASAGPVGWGGPPVYAPPAQSSWGAPPASYYGGPPPSEKNPPFDHSQSAPPQGQQIIVAQHDDKKKKGPLQGRLGQALVGGVGFGAGSAVAGNIVNAIL